MDISEAGGAGGVNAVAGGKVLLVPTLCVGMRIGRFASWLRSHAMRGNEKGVSRAR